VDIVYNDDNNHTRRFHSYTRYARKDMGYRDLPFNFQGLLFDNGLLLSGMGKNIFESNPALAEGIVEFSRQSAI
tara:strand:- start:232 stop:453 length:222 start_codon:yes stop_codon:yes gene_type:complete